MEFTTEKISGNQVKITFQVPAERFDEAMQKAYLKNRGRINVPGFRKGKAPRRLIENMYGEGVFYDDAFDEIFPEAYKQAVEQGDLRPVDQPSLDIEQIGSGQELKFSVEVYVHPDVTLGDYKKLTGTRHLHPITDEEIEHRISHDVDRVTTEEEVTDRATQDGDTVTLDYAGSVDGVPFEGGTAEAQKLTLGSGQFIPGFEEQVVGMEIGQEKDLPVTFPTEYHAEELAGKEAVFHVKVHGISAKMKPELDDEFAKDVSSFETFAAYREDIVRQLTEARDKNAEVQLENELIQQAVDQADCDIPQAMIEDEISHQLRNTQMRMAMQGLKYEDYLKYTGMTEDQVRDMFRTDAQNTVKSQLVIDAIVKQEGFEPTEEQVEQEIARHAKDMGRELEDYKKSLNERQQEYYKELAQSRMAIDMMKENAAISLHEGPAEEDINLNAVVDQVSDALEEQEEKPKKKRATKAKTKAEDKAEDKAEEKAEPKAKKAAKAKKEPKEDKEEKE